MALADGDTVLPVLPAAQNFQHGDDYPVFGIITTVGTGGVQWRNGVSSLVDTSTTLDVILAASAPTLKLTDWVRPASGAGNVAQLAEGVVVALFRRDNDGGDDPGPNRAVVFVEELGLYYEADESALEVVPSH